MTMRRCVRTFTIVLSACTHAVLFGGVYVFSRMENTILEDNHVYQVALAEFSVPAAPEAEAVPVPVPESTPPPPSELEPLPEPEVTPVPKKPAPEIISPKKKKDPAPIQKKEAPRPVTPRSVPSSPSVSHGPTAPVPGRIGSLLAYDTDQVDQRPSIVKRSPVEYPSKARRRAVEGRVVIQLVVDMEGRARECRVHLAEPAGWFEQAALSAAEKMRFMPGKLKGKAVNTVVLVPFQFSLR